MQKDLSAYIIQAVFAVFGFMTTVIMFMVKGRLNRLEEDTRVLSDRVTKNDEQWGKNLKDLTKAINQLQVSIAKMELVNKGVSNLESKVEIISTKMTRLETLHEHKPTE